MLEAPIYCRSVFKGMVFALAVAVLSASYYLVYSYETNIPQWDDFSLSLILLWLKGNTDGLATSFSILFSQFYEHKLVVYRLLACLDGLLFGQLNFKHLAYIGNAVNVLLLVLFFKIIKNDRHRALAVLPVILLFLIPFHWGEQTWRNGAGATYVLGFAGLAFYFVGQENKTGTIRFLLAFIFSTLAVFSTANGLLVSPVILVYFLFSKNRFQIVAWSIATLAQWSFYFLYDYEKVPYMPSALAIFEKAGFFIVSSGSAIAFGNLTVAWVVGLIVIISIVYLTLKRYVNVSPTLYLFLMFNVLTIAAVAWGRSRYGLATALSERYLYTSLITIMLVYIGMQEVVFKISIKAGVNFVCAMALIFFTFGLYSCYSGISVLDREKSRRIESLRHWLYADEGLRFNATLESDFILSTMLKSGLYSVPVEAIKPVALSKEIHDEDVCGGVGSDSLQVAYDVLTIPYENASSPLIRVEGIVAQETDPSKSIYVVLRSAQGDHHIYTTQAVNLQHLELSALEGFASRRRFVAMIPAESLRRGGYRVGICDGSGLVFNAPRTLVQDAMAAGLWRIHWVKRLIIEERRGLVDYAQSVSSLSIDR